jgi:hypothetical protein
MCLREYSEERRFAHLRQADDSCFHKNASSS